MSLAPINHAIIIVIIIIIIISLLCTKY